MKILERKVPKAWEYETTCTQCGSVLLVEPEDVKFNDFVVTHTDDHDWQYYFICPIENCAEIHFIPYSKITNAISMRLGYERWKGDHENTRTENT